MPFRTLVSLIAFLHPTLLCRPIIQEMKTSIFWLLFLGYYLILLFLSYVKHNPLVLIIKIFPGNRDSWWGGWEAIKDSHLVISLFTIPIVPFFFNFLLHFNLSPSKSDWQKLIFAIRSSRKIREESSKQELSFGVHGWYGIFLSPFLLLLWLA